MERLRLALNRRLYLGLFGFEAHLACYAPGARYEAHVDRFRSAPQRAVSTTLYLNEGWTAEDGGELRLYLGTNADSPFVDVAPLAGTLVVFASERFLHAVLPARRERLSITGWFTRRP
jgi:SM-20-related protein